MVYSLMGLLLLDIVDTSVGNLPLHKEEQSMDEEHLQFVQV